MTHFRLTLSRAVSRVVLAVASFFETSVDHIVSDFLELDAKLEGFIARREAEERRFTELIHASYDRETAVYRAENAYRDAVTDRADAAQRELIRADRIRAAVKELIGE